MKRSELFFAIKKIVENETEISHEQLFDTKERQTDIVDARYLLVHFLNDCGLSQRYISECTGFTHQCVSNILNNFNNRLKNGGKMFAIMCKRISNQLPNN